MATKRINNLPVTTNTEPGDVVAIDGATTRSITVENLIGPTVASLKDLAGEADKLPYFTGPDTLALTDLTPAARNLLDDADAAAMRSTIGVVIGTDVQGYDPDLSTWATKTPPSGAVVGTTDGQTLTNKVINGANNTITNVSLTSGVTGNLPLTNLAQVADDTILANVSGGAAAPTATSLSTILDAVVGNTQGALITRNATGWVKLDPGAEGEVLVSHGPGADLSFEPGGGGGGVIANEAEAEAGVSNTVYMSPLRTKQALQNGTFFDQLGTGAVSRSFTVKMREDRFSVKDFGALGNDSANDTAAIVAAIAAASASTYKRTVYFPAGIYRVTQLGNIPPNVTLEGENRKSSVIRTTSATGNVMSVNGQRVTVRNLTIDASVARTSDPDGEHNYINITTNSSLVTLKELDLLAPFVGIRVPNSIAVVTIDDVDIEDTVAGTGRSIDIEGGYAVFIDHLVCRVSGGKPFAHINLTRVEDLTLVNSQLISGGVDLNIAPGNGQYVALVQCDNTQFDDADGPGVRIAPTTGGAVREVVISSPWVKGIGRDVLVTNAGGGTVDSVQVVNTLLVGSDIGVDAVGVSNIMVNGCRIGGHSIGVSFTNVNGGVIDGNRIGPHGLFGANTIGVLLTGNSPNVIGQGNDLSGNITAVSTVGLTTTNCGFFGNAGYPTPGAAAIPVGPSPFTYTAGITPERIFINAGDVSAIAVRGLAVFTTSGHMISLDPFDDVTVTYGATAPTMVKYLSK